jgi:hypothetical protein
MTFFYFLFPGPDQRSRASNRRWHGDEIEADAHSWQLLFEYQIEVNVNMMWSQTESNVLWSAEFRWWTSKNSWDWLLWGLPDKNSTLTAGPSSKHQCIFTVTSLRIIIFQQQKLTPPSLRVFLVKSLFSLQQKYICTPNPGQISLSLSTMFSRESVLSMTCLRNYLLPFYYNPLLCKIVAASNADIFRSQNLHSTFRQKGLLKVALKWCNMSRIIWNLDSFNKLVLFRWLVSEPWAILSVSSLGLTLEPLLLCKIAAALNVNMFETQVNNPHSGKGPN